MTMSRTEAIRKCMANIPNLEWCEGYVDQCIAQGRSEREPHTLESQNDDKFGASGYSHCMGMAGYFALTSGGPKTTRGHRPPDNLDIPLLKSSKPQNTAPATEPAALYSSARLLHKGLIANGTVGLTFDCLKEALTVYLNAVSKKKIQRGWFFIVDFDQPISTNRGYLVNFETGRVKTTHVSHGIGSGRDKVSSLSNEEGSHASTRGFKIAGGAWRGKIFGKNGRRGAAVAIHGEEDCNNADFSRAILLHAARKEERTWGCLGIGGDVFARIQGAITNEEFLAYTGEGMDEYAMTKKIERSGGDGFLGIYVRFTGDGQHAAYLKNSEYMRLVNTQNGTLAGATSAGHPDNLTLLD